jgi:hypothetical protein
MGHAFLYIILILDGIVSFPSLLEANPGIGPSKREEECHP